MFQTDVFYRNFFVVVYRMIQNGSQAVDIVDSNNSEKRRKFKHTGLQRQIRLGSLQNNHVSRINF